MASNAVIVPGCAYPWRAGIVGGAFWQLGRRCCLMVLPIGASLGERQWKSQQNLHNSVAVCAVQGNVLRGAPSPPALLPLPKDEVIQSTP